MGLCSVDELPSRSFPNTSQLKAVVRPFAVPHGVVFIEVPSHE